MVDADPCGDVEPVRLGPRQRGQGAGGGSAGAEKRAGELQGLVGGAESDSET